MEMSTDVSIAVIAAIVMFPVAWLALLGDFGKHKTGPKPNLYDFVGIPAGMAGCLVIVAGVISLETEASKATGLLLITWGIILYVFCHKLMERSDHFNTTRKMKTTM